MEQQNAAIENAGAVVEHLNALSIQLGDVIKKFTV